MLLRYQRFLMLLRYQCFLFLYSTYVLIRIVHCRTKQNIFVIHIILIAIVYWENSPESKTIATTSSNSVDRLFLSCCPRKHQSAPLALTHVSFVSARWPLLYSFCIRVIWILALRANNDRSNYLFKEPYFDLFWQPRLRITYL